MIPGGSQPQSQTPPVLNAIQITQSCYGNALPLVYGITRIPGTLIWYNNFIATAHSTNSGGGKGGGGGGGTTSYTYSASFILLLCEGPITGVYNTFADRIIHGLGYPAWTAAGMVASGDPLTDLGFNLFTGAIGQAGWSYLSTNYPLQYLNYSSSAYLGVNSFQLGSSASLPNLTFEIQGLLWSLASPYKSAKGDIEPYSVLNDYCTDAAHGCSFPYVSSARNAGITQTFVGTAVLGQPTVTITASVPLPQACPVGTAITQATTFPGGTSVNSFNAATNVMTMANNATTNGSFTFTFQPSTWQAYCLSYGFYTSPQEVTQRAAREFITELLTISNSDAIWSGGQLINIPLADGTITQNGYTFIPNNGAGGAITTPIFIFTDDDYLDNGTDDPVIVTRKGVSQTFNRSRVEFLDRTNQYNTAIAESFDANDIAINGERIQSTTTLHSICDPPVARIVAQLIMQRQLYYKNSYVIKVRADYQQLEPMDVIALNDTGLGLVNALCRVNSIEEDAKTGELSLDVTELPFGPGVTPQYNFNLASRGGALTNNPPGDVIAPYIFMAPPQLVTAVGGHEVWIALGPTSNNVYWGGAQVWMSIDNVTYQQVGIAPLPSIFGTLNGACASAADPDTTTTLSVILNNTNLQLGSGSVSDGDNMRDLIYVDGEIMSYCYAHQDVGGVAHYTFTSDGTSGGTKRLRRGCYNSPVASHLTATKFIRLDQNIFRMVLDPGYLGQLLYFKFASFNVFGQQIESLASATAYSYTPSAMTALNGNQAQQVTLTGTAVVIGLSGFKQGAPTAWDSNIISTQAYPNGCYVAGTVSNNQGAQTQMLGLSKTQSTGEAGLSFAWSHTAGTWNIYELGTSQGSFGTPAAGDIAMITYDGRTVRYLLNGVLKRAVQSPGLTLYANYAFNTNGGQWDALDFGAMNSSQITGGVFTNTWGWVIGTSGSQGNFTQY